MSRPIEFRCTGRRCRKLLATVDSLPPDRVVVVPTCPNHSAKLTPKQLKAAVRNDQPIPVAYSTTRLTVPRGAGRVVGVDPVGPWQMEDPAESGDPARHATFWLAWADKVGRGGDQDDWVTPIQAQPGIEYPEWVNVKRPAKRVMTEAEWIEAGRPIELGLKIVYDD